MSLSKNILQTIIYYDILNYPLTAFEIWKNLLSWNIEHRKENEKKYKKCTLGEAIEVLDSYEMKKNIEEFSGFYFLKGRKELVGERIQKDKYSIVKLKIAERVAWWLRFVPFVRMAAVTGTLAMKNPERDSDIDFLVILKQTRIWTGRLLVTAMVHLLGKRRYGKKIKNRICLNYFITTGSLEIKKKDLFAANEYTFIYPLFGWRVYEKFCRENFGWIKKLKPNWEIPNLKPAKYYTGHSQLSRAAQRGKESLINFLGGDRIEAWLKKKQVEKIKRNPLTYKKGGYVEATDENLIFLPEPQGVRIEGEWKRRLELN